MAKVTHTVKKNETLSGIAAKYNTTVKNLVKLNDIDNPNLIYVGQVLIISGASSTTKKKSTTSSNKATVDKFGLQSTSSATLFATWKWSKKDTENYQVIWYYWTDKAKVWFEGSNSTVDIKQSTYGIPAGATKVKFKVKPIAKKKKKNGKETAAWTAQWSKEHTYNVSKLPPTVPDTPEVTIVNNVLTATVKDVTSDTTHIKFEVVKNGNTKCHTSSNLPVDKSRSATLVYNVSPGNRYNVCCRAYRSSDKEYSPAWSGYSDDKYSSPVAPSGFTKYYAYDETSVSLAWTNVKTDVTYDIEYTTDQTLFDKAKVDSETGITKDRNPCIISGLASGQVYFFRIRSVSKEDTNQVSSWSKPVSVRVGSLPEPPTTWSSTTTAVVGETVNLYWLHNCEDGSKETSAQLLLTIDDVEQPIITIVNESGEDDEVGASVYPLDTSVYREGATIEWKVRTAGITLEYNKDGWSIQRTITVHEQPELSITVQNGNEEMIDTVESFPIYIYGNVDARTQKPIGYHVTITSKETYETVDNIGNNKTVSAGDEVFSEYIDTSDDLYIELSAKNIDLENNVTYEVSCIVSMNSGLTDSANLEFNVSWTDEMYEPNAEILINSDTLVASIRPFLAYTRFVYYQVTNSSGSYVNTLIEIDALEGTSVDEAFTAEGDIVYSGIDSTGATVLFCMIESTEEYRPEGVTLSVYRREYDGSFVELATDIDNINNIFVPDPHPALDYARYRIVATDTATGAISFYDVPGKEILEKSVVIQWDEDWIEFDTDSEDILEDPEWSGNMLKLPYNIDVSDKYNPDVSLVEYIGREHPVSYYGTQRGESASWNVEIDKKDVDTLYMLRRLAIWMGDVYVREPSGSGYWANIKVSFGQTHCELTIPVSFEITRVEGGI